MGCNKKILNKVKRKQCKYTEMIYQDFGVAVVVKSKYAVVCNFGLATGINEKHVRDSFSPHYELKKVIIIPHKSYCFLEFKDEEAAKSAIGYTLEHLQLPQTRALVFMMHVETLPDISTLVPFRLSTETADSQTVELEGIDLIADFVDESEENILISLIDWSTNESSGYRTELKHRTVRHFGYEFCYETSGVVKECPLINKIPEECDFLIKRFQNNAATKNILGGDWYPDQLTVNYYQPGQGIPPHIDNCEQFDGFIVSLSLGSGILFDFRHTCNKKHSVWIARRSLLIMSKEARYLWSHGFASRRKDIVREQDGTVTEILREPRFSFTFRRLKPSLPQLLLSDSMAKKLEAIHVHGVYNVIGEHFNETRHKPWPLVVHFLQSLPNYSILVDIGCGNGKYLNVNQTLCSIGCEINFTLANVCSEKGYNIVQGDCLQLPFKSCFADACISIAVIHHLANPQRRRKAVEEILRILKPGGMCLIYVWAKRQNHDGKSFYSKQIRKLENVSKHNNTHTIKVSYDFEHLRNEKSSQNLVKSDVAEENAAEIVNKNLDLVDIDDNDTTDKDQSVTLPVHKKDGNDFQHCDLFVPWKLNRGSKEDSEGVQYLRYYHLFEEDELDSICKTFEDVESIKSYYHEGNWCVEFNKKLSVV